MPNIHEFITSAVDVDSIIDDVNTALLEDYLPLLLEFSYQLGVNEDDVDLSQPDVKAEFVAFIKDRAAEKTYESLDNLSFCIEATSDELSIWRAMTVPTNWLENGLHQRPIGIYWSHDKAAADAHWGDFSDGKELILLEGRVHIEDVDWHRTILMNATMEEEREISLKATARVNLISAKWRHETKPTIDLSCEVYAGNDGEEAGINPKM